MPLGDRRAILQPTAASGGARPDRSDRRFRMLIATSNSGVLRQPFESALMSKVTVMTGGPGVGKTTIVKAMLRILAAKGTEILLCAPTGRAAKRMTDTNGPKY